MIAFCVVSALLTLKLFWEKTRTGISTVVSISKYFKSIILLGNKFIISAEPLCSFLFR